MNDGGQGDVDERNSITIAAAAWASELSAHRIVSFLPDCYYEMEIQQ